MPDTRTERMHQIAMDLEEDGLYTRANSVYAITEQRDKLLIENARLADALRLERWNNLFK